MRRDGSEYDRRYRLWRQLSAAAASGARRGYGHGWQRCGRNQRARAGGVGGGWRALDLATVGMGAVAASDEHGRCRTEMAAA